MNCKFASPGRRRLGVGLLSVALACFSVGCGPSIGTVSGKVTYKGKPLTSGTVSFLGANNTTVQSPIDSEGKYSVKMAPGAAKITVSVPTPSAVPSGAKMMDPSKMGAPDKAPPSAEAAKEKPIKLPSKYSDGNNTPLTYTVKPGVQEHDISLD
jgi:hypothetical protein